MKFVLILYVCSYLGNTVCNDSHVVPLEFYNYTDCILQGYKSSHNTLKELYGERMEDERLAIRFECREVGTEAWLKK